MTKRLFKDKQTAMISGVCSGIAQYFDLDPSLVRIGFVLIGFAWFTGFIAYIVAACILPDKSEI